jgi:protein-disulfide isomerase
MRDEQAIQRNGPTIGGLLAGLLLVAGLLLATPGDGRAQTALPEAEIERIVREYLLREPEIIMQAIEELQRRREAQAAVDQRDRLAAEQQALKADPRDPILGNPEGDVTLVEFFDYRCGYCRIMAEPMQALLASDPDLRIVMKEFPILGPDSLLAARAALAAHEQGGYEAMHWALLAANRIDEAVIRSLALANGLDADRLFADMEADAVADHIQDNILLAQGLGINGTPSFIIGETVLPGAVPLERLTQLVDQTRAAGG